MDELRCAADHEITITSWIDMRGNRLGSFGGFQQDCDSCRTLWGEIGLGDFDSTTE